MTDGNQGWDRRATVAFFLTWCDFLAASPQTATHIKASSAMINITSFYSSRGNLSQLLSGRPPHFTIAVQLGNLLSRASFKRQTTKDTQTR